MEVGRVDGYEHGRTRHSNNHLEHVPPIKSYFPHKKLEARIGERPLLQKAFECVTTVLGCYKSQQTFFCTTASRNGDCGSVELDDVESFEHKHILEPGIVQLEKGLHVLVVSDRGSNADAVGESVGHIFSTCAGYEICSQLGWTMERPTFAMIQIITRAADNAWALCNSSLPV